MDQYRIVDDDREKQLIYQLRYDVYCTEKRWLSEGAYANAVESDEYDATALHIGAFGADNTLVGTVRLLFPQDDLRLPVERVFGVTLEPDRPCVEISRLVIRRDQRGLRALDGLLRFLRSWAFETKVFQGYAIVERDLLRLLVRLGFPFTQIRPAKEHFGALTFPIFLDMEVMPPLGQESGAPLPARPVGSRHS